MDQIYLMTGERTEFIEITDSVRQIVSNSGVQDGICCVFVPHTTAGITINESSNERIVNDMIKIYNRVVPFEDEEYKYVEGNSAAHIKASLMGTSENIIIKDGELQLGNWQGIYFTEFNGPTNRRVFVKIISEKASEYIRNIL